MHSIEAVMARDYARRGLGIIAIVFLAMLALPLWLLEALKIDGVANSHAAVVLHGTLTLAMGFSAAIAVFVAQGKLARFFVRPISAARLVVCQMTLGIATIALMYLGSAGLINLGGAGWPLLGPALFLATALACAMAAIWSLEGTVMGQLAGCTATSVPLAIWFSRCYGGTTLGDWRTMWQRPSALEALTLLGVTAAAYVLAVVGVTRIRRGDLWDFAALRAWWERLAARGFAPAPFAGPLAAQLWCEWREKMALVPACVVAFAILAPQPAWIAGWMPTEGMLSFAFGMPMTLLVVAMPFVYGLVAGNCGREGRTGMKHVLATRPVTDGFLAQAILRNCAAALALAWGTWLVGWLIAAGLACLTGHRAEVVPKVWLATAEEWKVILLIAVLIPLTSWTFAGLMVTLAAAGRLWLWVSVLSVLLGLALALILIKENVPPATYDALLTALLLAGGGLYLGGTAWAFVAAVRQRLISGRIVLYAVGVWIIGSLAMAFVWPDSLSWNGILFWFWHAVGFLALSIFPFAAMPLAIRWNRHR